MLKYSKLIIIVIYLSSIISPAVAIDYGNWSLKYYVDEFGDDTDLKYIIVDTEGLFSNSATTDSLLYVRMIISADNPNEPYFNFFEYGSRPLTSYDSSGDPYRCSMKNSNNEKQKLYAHLGGLFTQTTLWIGKDDKKKLNDWISLEEKIKFACYEEDNISSKYIFNLNFEGYSAAMQALR